MQTEKVTPFGSRRAIYREINAISPNSVSDKEIELFESFDAIYRSLCAMMYNFAPLSGHPGGSISSGRFVTALLYQNMDYDMTNPGREDADIISYAAGHKALGLYSHWALRNEIVRIAASEILPEDIRKQLRLEDLLGFRRNPIQSTPLFKKFNAKALDGHPTPATPFVKLSTGASGVGMASSIGLAYAAADSYGKNAPRVHIVEGEGGLTPGRVSEALAAAATAGLKNVVLHIDWNQASIDSNHVCRDDSHPGDYVQWSPAELTYLNDWNTILVDDGKDFRQILAAQELALSFDNDQPTAIIYKTIKGWNYGIEGSKSHGAGHALCNDGFHRALAPILQLAEQNIELCKDSTRCLGGSDASTVEQCFWDALLIVRQVLENHREITNPLAEKILASRQRLANDRRQHRTDVPAIEKIYAVSSTSVNQIPEELALKPGSSVTLRGELGKVLRYYNKVSGGAVFTAAADLLGSTSADQISKDFANGFFHATENASSRTLSIGGICEDAMAGIMAGISAYGNHIGVCSSYGAFIVALGHIAARLHAIGEQARQSVYGGELHPFFIISAHAGLKTGEDGPTHADPQPLQLIQENFPKGMAISLTPWDPQEMWPLVSEALNKRPAVIYPFVTRPNEKVFDREALGLAPATDAAKGVYLLRKSEKENADGVVVLQGSEVANEFVSKTLPMLLKDGIDLKVYYVASAELFDLLSKDEQEEIFPEQDAIPAMGITGFTLPTMYRWIRSSHGRDHSLYPFRKGHFLGSGKADSVVAEAGLDGVSQYHAIKEYLESITMRESTYSTSELINE